MRNYVSQDYDSIRSALLDEGFTDEQMTFETDETFINDDGFFSYRIESGFPRLIHFYTEKPRSPDKARRLIKEFRKMVIRENYPFFIMSAPKEKPELAKFIIYLKGKKYLEQDGDKYFYVPIAGRIK